MICGVLFILLIWLLSFYVGIKLFLRIYGVLTVYDLVVCFLIAPFAAVISLAMWMASINIYREKK